MCKEYRDTHQEKRKEYLKNYYIQNSERIKNRVAEAYKNITEEQKEKRKQYYHKLRATRAFKNKRIEYEKTRKDLSKSVISDLTEEQWNETFALFGFKCAYCEGTERITRDHIIPLTKGGAYTKNNIIPCCISCNSKKQNKNYIDWYKKQPFYKDSRLELIEIVRSM